MNFKYYRTETGFFKHWPVFLGGNSFELAREYTTFNIDEADFITLQIPNENSSYTSPLFFEELQKFKNQNKKIKCIIIGKEEHLNKNISLIYNLIDKKIFTKEEIFVSTCAINYTENKLFTPFPNDFAIHAFLSTGRRIANFEQLVGNEKSKKIVCLSRNHNCYRDEFFKKLYRKENENLFNSDNLIKYHMFSRTNYKKNDIDIEQMIKKIDVQKIHLNPDVSHERMFNINHEYYGELIPEYEKYYFSIVHESLIKDFSLLTNNNEYIITEKTLIPMLTKCIFFVVSHPFYESYLNRIGIQTFEEDFGIYYDSDNLEGKTQSIIKLMKKLNNMSYEEIAEIYNKESIQKKLKNNYELIINWSNQTFAKNKFENFLKNKLCI